MLVHLQSFNSIPEHYTIPESTKNGVPLFYIPPGSHTPVSLAQNYKVQKFGVSMICFHQGCMKLIRSDSKGIYNVIKDFYFK